MSWKSPELLYRTPGGEVKTWCVEVVESSYRTVTGGRPSAFTFCHAKNVGRANERCSYQVALDTAKSKFKLKLDEGYCSTMEELLIQDKIPRAMLAVSKLDITKVEKEMANGNVFVQPKLDGFRCIASIDGLFTRNLRKITTCNHVERALAPVFAAHPNLIIDGELYSHEFAGKFEKLQSVLTKEADLFSPQENESVIKYHVYDFVSKDKFEKRYVDNRHAMVDVPHVVMVRTTRVWNEGQIMELHKEFTDDKYEGTMVRVSKDGYAQNKRAKQLIKVKDFYDEEVMVTAIHEGNGQWTGYCKSISCVDVRGNTFDAGCSGTMELMSTVLLNHNRYIGGKATIKYFEKFASGKPRFPIAIKFYPNDNLG